MSADAVVEQVHCRGRSGRIKPHVSTISRSRVPRVGLVDAFRGRYGLQPTIKRAIVTLEEGQTIDVTTGL